MRDVCRLEEEARRAAETPHTAGVYRQLDLRVFEGNIQTPQRPLSSRPYS